MKTHIENPGEATCLCCDAAPATTYDPHLGDVCSPCRHQLKQAGLFLIRSRGRLKHPGRKDDPSASKKIPNN